MRGERRWIRVAIEGGFSSSSRSTLVAFGSSFCSPACDAAGIASPSPFLPSWRLQPTYLHRLFVHLLSSFLIDAGSLPFAFPAVNTIVLSFPRPSETSYIRLSLYPEEQREDSFLRVSLLRPQLPKSAELCFQGRSSISVFLSCSPSRQETLPLQPCASRARCSPKATLRINTDLPVSCVICSDRSLAVSTIQVPCAHHHHYHPFCLRAAFLHATHDESLHPPRCDGVALDLDLARPVPLRRRAGRLRGQFNRFLHREQGLLLQADLLRVPGADVRDELCAPVRQVRGFDLPSVQGAMTRGGSYVGQRRMRRSLPCSLGTSSISVARPAVVWSSD